MALFDWFVKSSRDREVKVQKRKQTGLQDSAEAVAFAEAGEHETACAMVDKTAGNRKILVVGNQENFSEVLVDYSFGMAKRLDFGLVMLNVTDAPLSLPEERREAAIRLFQNKCDQNFDSLQQRAEQAGVSTDHLVRIGDLDDVVDALQTQFPGMRYVLTEPDPEVAKKAKGPVSVPVFDLGSYHRAAVRA